MKELNTRDDLTPDARNANLGTERGRYMLDHSLRTLGAGRSIVVDAEGRVAAGNKTLEVAEEIGLPIRVIRTDGNELVVVQRTDWDLLDDSGAARQYAYADNRSSEIGLDWDVEQIELDIADGIELDELFFENEIDEIMEAVRIDEDAPADQAQARATLAERFIVPPFSVLDARQGYWQDRKRAWIALGIESELGRGANLRGLSEANDEYRYNKEAYSARLDNGKGRTLGAIPPNQATILSPDYKGKETASFDHSRKAAQGEINSVFGRPEDAGHSQSQTGTSIFDPVLCECAYTWFTGKGFRTLDPFAGGSVRGIVAAYLGREYVGIELREEQVEANKPQAEALGLTPRWLHGDSANVREVAPGEYDFVFSCPPYYNLEVYSELAGELSAAPTYEEFLTGYRHIIADSVAMLRDNRFACFVVGDMRDKLGYYRNFVSDTIAAFRDAGCELYNEAILVTAVGSLPIRVSSQFPVGRKLGKTHQNVLVFIKGDWRKAVEACGPCEVVELINGTPELMG